MEDKKYYVYIYYRLDTNEPFYVGKGQSDRWKCLRESRRSKHFMRIIDNYEVAVEIVKDNLTEEQAHGVECYLIHELVFEYGYSIEIPKNRSNEKGMNLVNATWGGEGGSGHNPLEGKSEEEIKKIKKKQVESYKETFSNKSEEEINKWKKKLSEANKGRIVPQDVREKISKSKMGELNPMYGKGHLFRGKNSPSAKSVICLTTKKIFDTVREGAEYYNTYGATIINCCGDDKKHKYAGRLDDGTKLAWMYLEDYEKATEKEIQERIEDAEKGRSVEVICITTNEIFSSVKQASEYYEIQKGNLVACCKGRRNYCGKINGEPLIWMYLDDYLSKGDDINGQ